MFYLFFGTSWDSDMERGARNVVITPFNHQDIVSPLLQHITDIILQVSQMFDQNLLTGNLRAMNSHQQHVFTCNGHENTSQ